MKPKLVTAQDIRADYENDNHGAAHAPDYRVKLETARAALVARGAELYDGAQAQNRAPTAEERREYSWAEAEVGRLDILNAEIARDEAHRTEQMRGVIAPATGPAAEYREGAPLAENQTFVGAMHAMGRIDDAAREEPLSLSKYLRGAMTGRWDNADREKQVMAALSGASTAAGGILLPEILSGELIDLARAQTRVFQAGARLVPMANRKVVVPKWASDPVPEWRGENEAFVEDDATLGSIELNAKGLGVVTKVSLELIEDSDIDTELRMAFAKSYAQVLDQAALYADGTNDAPTGIKATAGVNVQTLAANGASPTWNALVESVGRLRDLNEEPNAQILSDRTARSLALLTGGDGQYIAPPSYLDDVERLTTSQVPNNLTTGTSAGNTSDVFTGDWSKLLVGVRSELRIVVLNQRYLPDSGQIGFLAHWRGDFAVARPKAFDVVTGVKA